MLEKNQPEKAQVTREMWEDLIHNREKYRNQQMDVVIQQELDRRVVKAAEEFEKDYYVRKRDILYIANHYDPKKDEKQLGEDVLMENADYARYREETENPMNKLRYRREVREGYKALIEEKILPYIVD